MSSSPSYTVTLLIAGVLIGLVHEASDHGLGRWCRLTLSNPCRKRLGIGL